MFLRQQLKYRHTVLAIFWDVYGSFVIFCFSNPVFQEHKWKMYMEIDDESDDNDDNNDDLITCIKDVVFTSQQLGSFKLTHVSCFLTCI